MKSTNNVKQWFIYMIRCSDMTLYTGITTDIERRVREHNHSDRLGAKYSKLRRPVYLVYREETENRSSALKREHHIKKMPKKMKEKLANVYA